MTFFDDAWSWTRNAVSDTFNWGKTAILDTYHTLTPITDPIIQQTGNIINKTGQNTGKLLDNAGNVSDFISNPIVLIGLGIAAIIILPKVLEKL
jgi:hypothetical protein